MTERRGRPRKPIEAHKAIGTYRADRHGPAIEGQVVALPMASGVPDLPVGIGLQGRRLWEQVWRAGITWISPTTDMQTVEHACQLADDLALARERYHATRDPGDGRMVAAFSKEFTNALSDLGFNPTARAKLGVAEVTRVSKLEALRRTTG